MPIEPLVPFAGDHAIQNVVFVLEWNSALTAEDLRNVRGLHSAIKQSLPIVQEPRMVMININDPQLQAAGAVAASSTGEIGAVHFSRTSPTAMPGAIGRSLQVSRENCLAVVNDYTRWERVWHDVSQWLHVVMPTLVKGRAITSIGLQYTDVFQWRADPKSLDLQEVFNADSGLVAPRLLPYRELWHSHIGYYEVCQTPVAHRLLENVNVNILENDGQRSINIVTLHKADLQQPVWSDSDAVRVVDDLMPVLHDRNKMLLRSLLAQDVQRKIRLDGNVS